MSPIIFYFAAIVWYVVPVVGLAIGIYATIYFARLLDITKRQFLVAMIGGIILSILNDAFHYVTSIHMPAYLLYNDIYRYAGITIGSIIIVCLVYFIFAGRRNLKERYNIEISGLWPREIKKLKEKYK